MGTNSFASHFESRVPTHSHRILKVRSVKLKGEYIFETGDEIARPGVDQPRSTLVETSVRSSAPTGVGCRGSTLENNR